MEKASPRYLFVFLALVMWALSFPSIKVALEEVDPLTLAAIRFIIPLPIIFVFFLYEERESMRGKDKGEHQRWNRWGSGPGKGNSGKEELNRSERGRGEQKKEELERNEGEEGEQGKVEQDRIECRGVEQSKEELERIEGGEGKGFRGWLSGMFAHERRMTGYLMAFALFNVIVPNVFQNYGMQTASSGVSSIIQGSGPIFTIFLASVFLREHLSKPQLLGIMLALAGSLLLVSGGDLEFDGSTTGKVLMLLSAISYAISSIFAKIILKDLRAGELILKSFLIGGSILAGCAIILEDPVKILELEALYWYHIAFISLFPTCLAFIFWFRALKILPLSKLAITVFLIPLMAVIFSSIFLDEEVTMFTAGTGSMVILGVLIALWYGKGD